MAVHVGTLKDRCEKLQIAEQPTQDTRTCLQSVLFQTWNPYCSLNRFSPINCVQVRAPGWSCSECLGREVCTHIGGASFHFPGRFFICAWTPGFVLRLQTSPSFSFIRKRSLVGSTRGASVAFKVVVGVIEWARAHRRLWIDRKTDSTSMFFNITTWVSRPSEADFRLSPL